MSMGFLDYSIGNWMDHLRRDIQIDQKLADTLQNSLYTLQNYDVNSTHEFSENNKLRNITCKQFFIKITLVFRSMKS